MEFFPNSANFFNKQSLDRHMNVFIRLVKTD